MSQVTDTTPWYKQFWPWLLISIPATTAIAGFATIWVASKEPVALVHDDYYKEGMAVNRDLAKDRAAVDRKLSAQLSFDTKAQRIEATIDGDYEGNEVQLDFIHPVEITLDQSIDLQRQADGVFRAALPVRVDRWYLEIEAADATAPWRLKGEIDLRNSDAVILQADAI